MLVLCKPRTDLNKCQVEPVEPFTTLALRQAQGAIDELSW